MNFYDLCKQYKNFGSENPLDNFTDQDIQRALDSENLTVHQFYSLLSSRVVKFLEQMAQRANKTTLQYFGKAIQLYTPIYLSSYCKNECLYCGFNVKNKIQRKKLSLEELEKEAQFIANTGLQHVLILTGSSREQSPVLYIEDCVRVLKKYFSSISIEIYSLDSKEYKDLVGLGVDGLTIYQEVYDEKAYEDVHISGPKKDYLFRLDAPQRAAAQGMRVINIGVLLGLAKWQDEILALGVHAKYLQDKFSDAEISISVPRLRPHSGAFKPFCCVTDKEIVQIILALRIFLPRLGMTISTRESASFREHLLGLGVTRMSAGSTTAVGGHTAIGDENVDSSQFEISDNRSVKEIRELLVSKGYQPVLKDWMHLEHECV